MRNLITTFLAVGLIGTSLSAQAIAQKTREKTENREAAAASSLYVISAKAGAVNYVSGKVAVDRKDAKSGYLVKGDTVEKGERVRTENGGKAEILLNPGSYVRLSENADFRFSSTSLDDLQVRLTSGSAIFEIITDDDFKVFISTPKSSYQLIKSGVYRIDALSDGSGRLFVWKGKARYGLGKEETVKGGQTTVAINGQISVQKFDRDNKGEFEIWSKDRAKSIAQANAKLQQRTMSRSLISSFSQNNGWGSSGRFGLWVYDSFSSGYCFLPFGYGGSSPYGFGFNRSIWDYSLPNAIYNNVNPNWNNIRNQQNQNDYPANVANPGNPNSQTMPGGSRENQTSAPARDLPMSRPGREVYAPGDNRNERPIQMQRPIDQ